MTTGWHKTTMKRHKTTTKRHKTTTERHDTTTKRCKINAKRCKSIKRGAKTYTQNDLELQKTTKTQNHHRWLSHISFSLGILLLCVQGVFYMCACRSPISGNLSTPTYFSTRSDGWEGKISQSALGRWKRVTFVRQTAHHRTNIARPYS